MSSVCVTCRPLSSPLWTTDPLSVQSNTILQCTHKVNQTLFHLFQYKLCSESEMNSTIVSTLNHPVHLICKHITPQPCAATNSSSSIYIGRWQLTNDECIVYCRISCKEDRENFIPISHGTRISCRSAIGIHLSVPGKCKANLIPMCISISSAAPLNNSGVSKSISKAQYKTSCVVNFLKSISILLR